MSVIPEINCPKCGALMEYWSGPIDSNIFIMRCTREERRYEQTYHMENSEKSRKNC